MAFFLGSLFSILFLSCERRSDYFVVRGQFEGNVDGFDSTILINRISESLLGQAGHLYITTEVRALSFEERSYVERYLEAGGLVSFSCRDTIYNWGEIKSFLQEGSAKIQCENPEFTKARLNYDLVTTIAAPGMDRLVREVLVAPLAEPIDIAVTNNSFVYWIERKGAIHTYHPGTDQTRMITQMDVYTGEEDGLLGIELDPDFDNNNWVYLFYSPPGDEPKQHVSRFVLTPDSLHLCTEKLIIEIPTQRDECCHSAGDIKFDSKGNLFISTGDNTFSRASDGFTPLDERPGRSAFDSQKSSSNTNDLRGKVLRIHPEKDGSYTIPDGNLFAKDGSEGLPEIYVMGARNPFTIAYNKYFDWLYWGDVGPDGNVTSERGPSAHDEINFAPAPGNYGWPYFNANNLAYADYDFETGKLGPRFDPLNPVNTSVNNTGSKELPEAIPAMVYYTFDETPEFPGVGKGSRSTGAGDVYDYQGSRKHGNEFPPYYHNKLFAFDWARDWIMVVNQDKDGNFLSISPFLDNSVLASPIAMDFGPDGALYVLEYGIGYFTDNHDSKLIRLEFINGNRPPVAEFSLNKTSGATPLEIILDGSASKDPDNQPLKYFWEVNEEILEGQKLSYSFSEVGQYDITLKVVDSEGALSSITKKITAGNTAPDVKIAFGLNQTFYKPGYPIEYQVLVADEEDGTIGNSIKPENVNVFLTKYSGSDNRAAASLAQLGNLDESLLSTGLQLIQSSDCKSCHKLDEVSIGPSFKQIADRYDKDYIQMDLLAKKIINGGSGVWGDGMMIAHPNFSMKAAREIVKYIFAVNDPPPAESEPIDVRGVLATSALSNDKIRFEVSYKDQGGSISLEGKQEITLIPPKLEAEQADKLIGFEVIGGIEDGDDRKVRTTEERSSLTFTSIDLTNVTSIELVGDINMSGEISLNIGNGANSIKVSENKSFGLNQLTGIHDLQFDFKSIEPSTVDKIIFRLNTTLQ